MLYAVLAFADLLIWSLSAELSASVNVVAFAPAAPPPGPPAAAAAPPAAFGPPGGEFSGFAAEVLGNNLSCCAWVKDLSIVLSRSFLRAFLVAGSLFNFFWRSIIEVLSIT